MLRESMPVQMQRAAHREPVLARLFLPSPSLHRTPFDQATQRRQRRDVRGSRHAVAAARADSAEPSVRCLLPDGHRIYGHPALNDERRSHGWRRVNSARFDTGFQFAPERCQGLDCQGAEVVPAACDSIASDV